MTVLRLAQIPGVLIIAALTAPPAFAYIHFPPMKLPKMCKDSHHIRLLKITKLDKEKGVIIFDVAESLKGDKSSVTSFRHFIRPEIDGAKKILDWADAGKTAVMFTMETKPGFAASGFGYVFIDEHCYSVDYSRDGKYWLLLRGEPGMSACYFGSVEKLRPLVMDLLAGKDVTVPVKEPGAKEDTEKRRQEINDGLKKSRGPSK